MKKNFKWDSKYNSEFKQRIQELIEHILDLDYGNTIDFNECSHILHYNTEDEKEYRKFKSTMARVKSILIDYGYVLKTITNVGYYILKPKQISGYCYHTYIRRTENLLEKSQRVLVHTDQTELSTIRKEEYDNLLKLNDNVSNNIWKTILSSEYYNKKSYYDNLED